jgi:hypothetical protein
MEKFPQDEYKEPSIKKVDTEDPEGEFTRPATAREVLGAGPDVERARRAERRGGENFEVAFALARETRPDASHYTMQNKKQYFRLWEEEIVSVKEEKAIEEAALYIMKEIAVTIDDPKTRVQFPLKMSLLAQASLGDLQD